MNAPIQPTAPVNTTITIQPVVAAPANNNTGAAPNPLASVATGTIIEGFVVNRDAQNNPIVRTPLGDLKVTSEFFLKTGSEVVFRVDTTQASLARILTVDGLTPELYNAQNAPRGLTGDTVTTTALQSPLLTLAGLAGKPTGPLFAGAPVLQAILLQSQPNTALHASPLAQAAGLPVLAQLAGLKSGTPLKLTLLDLKLPPLPVALGSLPVSTKIDALVPQRSTAATPLTPSTPPSTTAPGMAQTQAQTHSAPPTTAAPITPTIADELTPLHTLLQQREQVRAVTMLAQHSASALTSELLAAYTKATAQETASPTAAPPAAQTPPSPASRLPNVPSQVITAHVIGHDAEGANILHTAFASLKLYTSQPLPTGTTLVVQAHLETAPPAATGGGSGMNEVSAKTSAFALPASPSDALEDVMAWLTANHPDIARETRGHLPTLSNTLSSGLLFFIAAAKGGDVAAMLGKRAARQLEFSAPELLSRLRKELTVAGETGDARAGAPWITLTIPMLHGQQIEPLRLYLQREPEEESSAHASGKGQRFVLEVTLSQLGPLQLDGFVRPLNHGKNFDLMVRSGTPLPPEISQGIRSVFEEAMVATRLTGQVVFQTGAQHFFRPAAVHSPTSGNDNGTQTILA